MSRIYYVEVRARKWKGSVSRPNTMQPTDEFYHRPPFMVREHEIGLHVANSRFEVNAVKSLKLGNVFIDRRGDRWTRTA